MIIKYYYDDDDDKGNKINFGKINPWLNSINIVWKILLYSNIYLFEFFINNWVFLWIILICIVVR